MSETMPHFPGGVPRYIVGDRFVRTPAEGFDFPMHRHEDFTELLLVREGRGIFVIDGETYEAEPGSLLCYNRGIWHEEHADRRSTFEALYIAFEGMHIDALPPDHLTGGERRPCFALGNDQSFVERRMLDIVRESAGPHGSMHARQSSCFLLGALLVDLHRMLYEPASPAGRTRTSDQALATTVKVYIQKHYDKGISLSAMAEEASVSESHLCRAFKRETGMTTRQYVQQCRVEAAKRYLTATTYTIPHIAEIVGYRSETYFHEAFKRHAGLSPGQYRASYRRS